MPQALCVERRTDIKSYISWIPIKNHEFVGEIIREIREDTQLAIPKNTEITLHGPSGTVINPTRSISVLIPENSAENPVHVQVSETTPHVQASALLTTTKEAFDTDLTSFWDSLRKISKMDGFLHFEHIPPFFPDNFEALYVRKAYEDLFAIICKNCDPDPPKKRLHGMAISGTPGIGKSMFLFYVLWRLANMELKGTVILRRQLDEEEIYVFQNEGCWITMDHKDIRLLLKDPNTWYLTDALLPPPGLPKAITILVSSPSEKYYSEFLKYSHVAPLHYLPVWSLDELKLVAPSYNRSEDVVKERFDMIGGVPRYVLEKDDDLEEIVKLSMEKLPLDKLILIALGKFSKEDQISHQIVHFKVEPPLYTKRTLTITSMCALNKASEKFLALSDNNLKHFIFWSTGIPSLAFFRARAFEDYGHRRLSRGGDFLIRSLDDETEETLKLPRRSLEVFQDLSKCNNPNVYYKSSNPNFPCIDSVIPGVGYFQMTTSLDHQIEKREMSDIISIMHIRKFYFVVPDQNFRDFRKQNLEKDIWKDQDQKSEVPSQMSRLGMFEGVVNLDENLMEGEKLNDSIWNSQRGLMEQYVINIPIDIGLDF